MFTHAAFRLFDTTYPAYRVFMLLTAIAMFAALLAVLARTRVGLIIQPALALRSPGSTFCSPPRGSRVWRTHR